MIKAGRYCTLSNGGRSTDAAVLSELFQNICSLKEEQKFSTPEWLLQEFGYTMDTRSIE